MKATRSKVYSSELKEAIARRYTLTDASYQELGSEIGVDKSTVCGWVRQFRETGTVGKRKKKKNMTTDGRSAAEKLGLIVHAGGLPEQERGEFLRREGIHDDDLARWNEEAVSGLQGGGASRTQERRIQELERTSKKQGRRLREAEALLDLQKKVQALWGDEDDDTAGRTDKC